MSEVYKLGISTKNNQPINEVNSIEVLTNQGVVGDRHFKEFNYLRSASFEDLMQLDSIGEVVAKNIIKFF